MFSVVLSSQFFCEKFFVGCVFSVVLSSQFFCEKFFVRSVFLVVLSSEFSVPSIFYARDPRDSEQKNTIHFKEYFL